MQPIDKYVWANFHRVQGSLLAAVPCSVVAHPFIIREAILHTVPGYPTQTESGDNKVVHTHLWSLQVLSKYYQNPKKLNSEKHHFLSKTWALISGLTPPRTSTESSRRLYALRLTLLLLFPSAHTSIWSRLSAGCRPQDSKIGDSDGLMIPPSCNYLTPTTAPLPVSFRSVSSFTLG